MIPNVHLGEWFHFTKSWELPDSAKFKWPSFCQGLDHHDDTFIPIPVASMCSADSECTGTSECIDTLQTPIQLKQCQACPNQGQATCSVFSRSCSCGTASSYATACSTNSQCYHPTSKCIQVRGPFTVPNSIAPCMSAQSPLEAMLPMCVAGVISVEESSSNPQGTVCTAASSVNAALGVRVPSCNATSSAGSSCSLGFTDPTQSCLALQEFPTSAVTAYDDLRLVSCGICDDSRGFVCVQFQPKPSTPMQSACVCVMRSEQYQSPGASRRRLLAASRSEDEEQQPRLRLEPWSPEHLQLGLREVSRCSHDLDCRDVHPPAVCQRTGYYDNATSIRVWCDSCPAGSNLMGLRPRVCVEGQCQCERHSDYGVTDLLLENGGHSEELMTGIVRRELRVERHGTCAVLMRGLADRAGRADWSALLESASLAERALLEGCVQEIVGREFLQRLTGAEGFSLPLLSLENIVGVGAQAVGAIRAVYDVWGRQSDPLLVWTALRNRGVNPQVAMPLLQRAQAVAASLHQAHVSGLVWNHMDAWADHPDTHPRAAAHYRMLRSAVGHAQAVWSDTSSGAHTKWYAATAQALRPRGLRPDGSPTDTAVYNEHVQKLMPKRQPTEHELAVDKIVPPPTQPAGTLAPPRRSLKSVDPLAVPVIDLADSVKQCAVAEDLIELTAETFILTGNYYRLLFPTLLERLGKYLVEPYGTPPDRPTTKSIVYDSSVTIRPRPAPPETRRIREFYEVSNKDSIQDQLLGWLLDTPIVKPLDELGAYFVTPKQTEETIVSQFGCSPRSIMLSDRAEDPLWSAATVALTILALFLLGLLGVPLARPIAMLMLGGYLVAWIGHAYGVSFFCMPALPTAAFVDLLDIVNRYTPPAHVHSLMLEQLVEGTTWNSADDSPSQRCEKLGFVNGIDSLIYLLSVSATALYACGWSCFQRAFCSEKPAAPPLERLPLLLTTLRIACFRCHSAQCSSWCLLAAANRVRLWLKFTLGTLMLFSRTHRASSTLNVVWTPK